MQAQHRRPDLSASARCSPPTPPATWRPQSSFAPASTSFTRQGPLPRSPPMLPRSFRLSRTRSPRSPTPAASSPMPSGRGRWVWKGSGGGRTGFSGCYVAEGGGRV